MLNISQYNNNQAVIGTWECEGHHANVMPDGALKGTLNRAPCQGWNKMAAVHAPWMQWSLGW